VRGLESLRIYRPQSVFENTIDIFHNIVVPVTKDEIATCFQIIRSLQILLLFCMLAAIKFDNEFSIWATEIGNVAIDRHLPTELPTVKPAVTQPEPY